MYTHIYIYIYILNTMELFWKAATVQLTMEMRIKASVRILKLILPHSEAPV